MKSTKGNSAAVFKLKDKIHERKKSSIEPSAILHPEKKTVVTNPKEIKSVSADYLKKLLTTREPKQEYKQDLVLKRKVHDVRMNKRDENEKQLTKEMFRKALENIGKKGGNKNEFFLKA